MTYEIAWTGPARKGMKNLQPKDQRRIADAIAALKDNPRPMHAKKLEPKEANRYRFAPTYRLRIVYSIDDANRVVVLWDVTTREGAY